MVGGVHVCCHLCKARLSTKGNFKCHVQTHSGVKPWACDQCEGRFTEKKSLKIHMRRYTGEGFTAAQYVGKLSLKPQFCGPLYPCILTEELISVICVEEVLDKRTSCALMCSGTLE